MCASLPPTQLELAKGLQDSTKITLVDLTACRFVRRSPIALANVFRGNGCLKTVKLGWNGFADLGAAAVAEALKQNDCLTELSLANNRIGETGCKALAKALEGGGNSTLTSLDLSLVRISPPPVSPRCFPFTCRASCARIPIHTRGDRPIN